MGWVRDAESRDAEACAAIHVASWKAAYRGMMPDEYLDNLSIDDRLPGWRRSLASERLPGTVIVVVEDEGLVCGFATCRSVPGAPGSGEVGAIYLDTGSWDRGLGAELMSVVTERARAFGFEELTLWVHPQNARARHFYERGGWQDDDHQQLAVVWGLEVPECRYRLALGES